MVWVERQTLTGSNDWQFTDEIASSLVRLRWDISKKLFYKALVARVRMENGIPHFYEIRKLWTHPENQILNLDIGEEDLKNSRLAFKVVRGVPEWWTVTVDAWDSPMDSKVLVDVTQNQLADDKITITHNLDSDYPSVTIYDATRKIIGSTSVTAIDGDSVEIDFTDLAPLSGVYKIKIQK